MAAITRFVRLDGNNTEMPPGERLYQDSAQSTDGHSKPEQPLPPMISDLHARSAHGGVFLRWINTDREGLVTGYQITTRRGQHQVRTEYAPAGVSGVFITGLEADCNYRFDVAVLSCGVVGDAVSTDSGGSVESPLTQEEAERIALSYLRGAARILVEGPVAMSDLSTSPATASALTAVENARTSLRANLAGYGLRYTSYEVDVEDSALVPGEGSQTVELHLRVRETFKQEVDGGPELPDTTAILPYSFTLALDNGSWILKHVAESDGFGDGQRIVAPQSTEPANEVEAPMPAIAGGKAAPVQDVEPLAVNTGAIVNYAYKWAHGRNPDYTKWGTDCTNFASQAAQAGGLGEIAGDYWLDEAWWYHGWWPIYSTYTWRAAHNLWCHLWKANRAVFREHWNETAPGDILLWDFDGDGHIDHISIITSIINGVPHYTQHTDDKVDESIYVGLNTYPNAKIYMAQLTG